MKSIAAVLISILLCVQPVCAMSVREPILYAETPEETETTEETEVQEEMETQEEKEVQEEKEAQETVESETDTQEKTGEQETGEQETGEQESTAQAGIEVSAPSAVLMESSTGQVIYEKDADTQRPPASVTKVMTLLLIFDALEDGKIQLEDEVTTSEYAASMGGSQVFLEPGEVQTVDTMIKCISVASANDACVPFHNSRQKQVHYLEIRCTNREKSAILL